MAENLFPVVEVPDITIPTQSQNRPYQKSVFFDYDKGDFRLDGAYRMTESSGHEAYMQWCRKVVATERDCFMAYSTDIGTEMEDALNEQDRFAVESALERTITEALMVNVHTEYVRDFEFEWGSDGLKIDFTVKGKEWGEETISTTINT